MSQQIFFAHANGFPSGTYGKLFAALAPEYQVRIWSSTPMTRVSRRTTTGTTWWTN
jgi:hypothetical protein